MEKQDAGLEQRFKLQTERNCIGWSHGNTKICMGEKDGNQHKISMIARDYHHCRNCGQQVCKKHSTHDLIIFRYAIGGGSTRALRSCDKCFFKEKEIIQQIQTITGQSESNVVGALRQAMVERRNIVGYSCSNLHNVKRYNKIRKKCLFSLCQSPRLPGPWYQKKAIEILGTNRLQPFFLGEKWTIKKTLLPLKYEHLKKHVHKDVFILAEKSKRRGGRRSKRRRKKRTKKNYRR